MIRKHSQYSGFTIVELMIAMGFISLLLLAIAGAVMQIGAIYNKGITMKSVDQAGRLVVSDIKRTIGESQPFEVAVAYKPHVRSGGSLSSATYDGGRLCTGIYSYVWNIGVYIDPDSPESQINRYEGEANSNKPLRLVKIRDNGGQYCKEGADKPVDYASATELLSRGDVATGDSQTTVGSLAVQDFRITRTTNNAATGMAVYSIAIVISDADREAIDTVDNSCRPPNDLASNQDYCAVNEFVFTARAGNKGE